MIMTTPVGRAHSQDYYHIFRARLTGFLIGSALPHTAPTLRSSPRPDALSPIVKPPCFRGA
jgi:hypothetical protein